MTSRRDWQPRGRNGQPRGNLAEAQSSSGKGFEVTSRKIENEGVGGLWAAELSWVDRFLEERHAQGLASSTLSADRRALGQLFTWMSERDLSFRDLTPVRLAAYLHQLRSRPAHGSPGPRRPIALATLEATLRTLRVWFRYLVGHEILLLDPIRGIHVTGERRLCGRGVFSVAEVCTMFAALEGDSALLQRDRALFGLMYGTGLRVGEVVALDLADYNPDEGQIWVRRGKWNKGRVLPVGRVTRHDLGVYLDQGRPQLADRGSTPALFVSLRGLRLGRHSIHKRLLVLQQRARVTPPRSCHAFRHAFATHMLARGADIRVLQMFLDHESADTTVRYTDVQLEELRRALRRAHPAERASR